MALRLNDLVVSGELDATGPFGVRGWLRLRGSQSPLMLELTGLPSEDLAGRRFYFQLRRMPDEDAMQVNPTDIDLDSLARQQVGATGEFTAARQVRTSDCPTGEMLRRIELDEPPPMEWKRCLYLEWFSQNGRVVLEMPDPVIELLDEKPADEDAAQENDFELPSERFGGTEIEMTFGGELGEEESFESEFGESSEADDPYGLFSDDLQGQLDAAARETDWAIQSQHDPDTSRDLREMEMMDEAIEGGEGVPLSELLTGQMQFPSPDDLDEEEAHVQLKLALGHLALFGVALDVCEHFSPQQTYRLLLEEIAADGFVYPELRSTQWVQHFSTWEYCAECEAELLREAEERGDDDDFEGDDFGGEDLEGDVPEDDVPF